MQCNVINVAMQCQESLCVSMNSFL
uniref:Uncharacterized protein n=1 Tax=Anguilla anguilla TaxID=7936 RepID=A0A0E9TA70_ANGAN